MKKYNSWEELKECFTGDYEFECEGEQFTCAFSVPASKTHKSRNVTTVKNTFAGVQITVQRDTRIDTYFYNLRK